MENHYLWAYNFPMKKGEFDNEYYFYENGKILHVYDKSKTKVNIEEFVSASDIPEHERQQIINACPDEFKERIITMLTIDHEHLA